MRTWRYLGVHRLTWVLLALLVVAVAVFAMAAGFSRLRHPVPPPPPASWELGRSPGAAYIGAELCMPDRFPGTAAHGA
jgi:hypothetical protein